MRSREVRTLVMRVRLIFSVGYGESDNGNSGYGNSDNVASEYGEWELGG